jgi:deoxyribose-phosphate aldolase
VTKTKIDRFNHCKEQQDMAAPETNEAWQELIDDVASKIQPHEIEPKYSFPDKQTAGFRGLIDHTLLKLDATAEQIDQLCVEAWEWEFAV